MSALLITLFFLVSLLPCLTQAVSTGSVAVYSDSSCANAVFSNNFTLAADICGAPGAVKSFDNAYNSYVVNSRPLCASGSKAGQQADFALYTDAQCHKIYQDNPPSGNSYDGYCLGLVEYLAVAFICDGLPKASTTSINTLPTIAPVTVSPTSTSSLVIVTNTVDAVPGTTAAVTVSTAILSVPATGRPSIPTSLMNGTVTATRSVGIVASSPSNSTITLATAPLSSGTLSPPGRTSTAAAGALSFGPEAGLLALAMALLA